MGNNRFTDRTGEENYNNDGCLMKIVQYNNARDIIVEFQDNFRAKIHTDYSCFHNSGVKNPYHKHICGVGYLGIGSYSSRVNNILTDQYNKWDSMIRRCYDKKFHLKRPTYNGCEVCEEWHNFQNFARWYDENYYQCGNETMCIDKDIIKKGNKIYSPESCIFAPAKINTLFENNKKTRGQYPVGVSRANNNKFRAYYSKNHKQINLGVYDIPDEAFLFHKRFKEQYIKQIANEYMKKYPQFPQRLYDAMYNYKIEIDD